MKAHELEELQEEAHAAYHQGDYSATIELLGRAIEVRFMPAVLHSSVGVSQSLMDETVTVAVCFQISPWDPESRELRAECYIRMGDPQKAIQDLTPTTRLRNDNRAAFLKLSLLHYSQGEHHESLK